MLFILCFSCKKKNTDAISPSVTTTKVTEILYETATSGGTITNDGGSAINLQGVCWGTDTMPTIENNRTGDGIATGAFTSSITGLEFGTSYYVRAYATSSAGTGYGSEIKFTTKTPDVTFNPGLTYGTVTDIDGNNYKTIQIGTLTWMAENLKTSRLNDGTAISLVTNNSDWINNFKSAYCWFDDSNTIYEKIYGAYYNWFTVNTGILCPIGWHVPSDREWQLLVDYLGGSSSAGSKIKEAGTNNWIYSNSDATNTSGFTALPAGLRGSSDGTFSGQGCFGEWWSSTELYSSPLSAAWCRYISGDSTSITRDGLFKIGGFSVRCLKN